MNTTTGKRTAKVKLTLTRRTVENLQPADKPWIAWDARLIGFGVRVQPSGAKAFIINYRTGSGGRKARNRRIAIGRCGHLAPEEARRRAQELLGRVARGEDPAQERADSRGMPTLVGDGRRVAVGRHELLPTVTGDKRVREEDRGDHSCAGGQAHEVDSGRGSGGEPDA